MVRALDHADVGTLAIGIIRSHGMSGVGAFHRRGVDYRGHRVRSCTHCELDHRGICHRRHRDGSGCRIRRDLVLSVLCCVVERGRSAPVLVGLEVNRRTVVGGGDLLRGQHILACGIAVERTVGSQAGELEALHAAIDIRAAQDDGHHVVFRRRAGDGLRHRRFIGTGNVDRNGLDGRTSLAVVHRYVDGVGHLLAFGQRLHLGAGVVQHIGPLACRIDGKAAVLALAAIVHGPGVGVLDIHIRDGQLAGDRGSDIFLDGAGDRAAQCRGVVGTRNRDRDGGRG